MSKICILTLVLFCCCLQAQMINPGFELTTPGSYTSANAVAGWTVESRTANSACTFTNWTPGSPELTVRTTPFTNYPFPSAPHGIINHSPLGGNNILQIGDTTTNQKMTRIRQTFPVTFSNTLLQIAHANYLEDSGMSHGCCHHSGVTFNIYDCAGNKHPCVLSRSVIPTCASAGVTFSVATNGAHWSNWQITNIDLSMFEGNCVTLEMINTDCSFGCHFGSSLLDFSTGSAFMATPAGCTLYMPPPVPAYCPNTSTAQFMGPFGYTHYQWISPSGPVAPPQGTMQVLNVSPAFSGSNYTLISTTANNCQYLRTFTVSPTQVDIGGLAVTGSCPGGSAGAATVFAVGSPAGYTYTWTNTSGSVVSTASVATSLAPGNYTLSVAGSTLVPCGSATTVVTIPAALPKVTHVSRTYCSQAYLSAPSGGTNFKWYYNNALLPGLTQPSYTVTTPCNACTYTVAYDNVNGCRDSVAIHTFSVNPGLISFPALSLIPACHNTANGSALVNIHGSSHAPGPFSVNISSIGNTPTFSLGSIQTQTVQLNNLSIGSYSVGVFDGACRYSSTFQINRATPDFSISVPSATICQGKTGVAQAHFTAIPPPNQISYTWTPGTWLLNNAPGWNPNRTISPGSLPQGSFTTIIYTITGSSVFNYCPVTTTLAITTANPIPPDITPIPIICSNITPFTMQVNPPGGTYDQTGGKKIIDQYTGLVNPAGATAGTYTITYNVNFHGCPSSTSTPVTINKFISASLTTDTAFLCLSDPVKYLHWYCKETIAGQWSGPHVQHPNFDTPNAPTGFYTISYKTASSPNPTLCPDSSSLIVNVAEPPVISVQSPTICAGQPVLLYPTGAHSYSYSPGKGAPLPLSDKTYSVWGISKHGCMSFTPTLAHITVHQVPQPLILSTDTLPCIGDAVVLSASGASQWQWVNGPASSSWTVFPSQAASYTVAGTNGNCTATSVFHQAVEECISVAENGTNNIKIYPNPFREALTVNNPYTSAITATIYDVHGRQILRVQLSQGNHTLESRGLQPGVYLLHLQAGNLAAHSRILIKEP